MMGELVHRIRNLRSGAHTTACGATVANAREWTTLDVFVTCPTCKNTPTPPAGGQETTP